jgi:hypothetical protein
VEAWQIIAFLDGPARYTFASYQLAIPMDNELLRIWQLVHELSEQLAHNQKITNALQSQANTLKVRISINILRCPKIQFK